MVSSSLKFMAHRPVNLETLVSKLSLSFLVINVTWEAVHVQFPSWQLIYMNMITLIAYAGSIKPL